MGFSLATERAGSRVYQIGFAPVQVFPGRLGNAAGIEHCQYPGGRGDRPGKGTHRAG
jgi:hypothetical protein